MKTLRFAAIDIDGVLLPDTFSPVLRRFVLGRGGDYTREVERRTFSRGQQEAAAFLIEHLHLNCSIADCLSQYFEERRAFLSEAPLAPVAGAGALLEMLRAQGLRLLCYGGLAEDHFRRELGALTHCFERYICTNDFRPGLAEIARDVCQLPPRHVLYIDDVNTVAEHARALRAPFIGLPSGCYQREDMERTGVRHLVSGIEEITAALIQQIDAAADHDACWDKA